MEELIQTGHTKVSSEQLLQRYQELLEQALKREKMQLTVNDERALWGLSKKLYYDYPGLLGHLKQQLIDNNLWILDNLDLKEYLGLLVAYANIDTYEKHQTDDPFHL